jgi:hypothetical protein
MKMAYPDPFATPEPGFERWSGPQHNPDFSQPDLTPCSLKEWLRSDEVQKTIATQQPPAPAPVRQRGWRLPNIPGFPN